MFRSQKYWFCKSHFGLVFISFKTCHLRTKPRNPGHDFLVRLFSFRRPRLACVGEMIITSITHISRLCFVPEDAIRCILIQKVSHGVSLLGDLGLVPLVCEWVGLMIIMYMRRITFWRFSTSRIFHMSTNIWTVEWGFFVWTFWFELLWFTSPSARDSLIIYGLFNFFLHLFANLSYAYRPLYSTTAIICLLSWFA